MALAVAKPSFEDFIRTCTPLLKIPELEQLMRKRVRSIVTELLNFESSTDPAQNLKQFLQKDENFLGILLALTNLSQEKFLRIITAQRFAAQDFGAEWSAPRIYAKIKKDDTVLSPILFNHHIWRLREANWLNMGIVFHESHQKLRIYQKRRN